MALYAAAFEMTCYKERYTQSHAHTVHPLTSLGSHYYHLLRGSPSLIVTFAMFG